MRFLFNPITSQFNSAPPREIVYSETAPAFPVEGTRWVNTLEIREYVFTFDANGAGYWVEVGIGSTGPQGEVGDIGPVGPVGPVGPQGVQGPAATVAVGTVTTGEPGTSVAVSNAGTSGAAVLDFTIPRGAVGQTGAVGPQGPQGIQGPKGDDGASIVLKGAVNFYSDLPTTGNTQGDLYVVQNDGYGYVWDGSGWVNVGQIRGPKGDTGAQGPAGPAPAGTGAVVVNNGAVGTPVGYGTANVAGTLVQRDASGNFSAGTITANVTGNVTGSVTGGVSGNAGTATKLATARTISVSGDVTGTAQTFDGSANITIPTAITTGSVVNADISETAAIADTKLATISTAGKVSNSATTATNANTANAIVARDANGNFSANQITANLTGNVTGNATNVSGTVAIANGGTGSTTAAGALVNLGAATSGHTHTNATATVGGVAGVAGFMSAADKTKLDGATSADTANAIVARDSSGGFAAGTVLSTPILYTNNQDGAYLIAGANGWTGETTNWGTYGFQHKIKSNSGGVPRLTIDDNFGELFTIEARNVGIGTHPSPSAKLNVGGTIAATTIRCNRLENAESNDVIVIEPTDDSIRFISNDTERMRVTSDGSVGIGTSTPGAKLDVRGDGRILGNLVTAGLITNQSDTGAGIVLGSASDSSNLQFRKLRGTFAAPAIVQDGDGVGSIIYYGHDGNDINLAGQIACSVDGTPSAGKTPIKIDFQTRNNAGNYATRLLIDNNGDVRIGAISASAAGTPLITGANGAIRAGAFGTTAGSFCQGNDPRLTSGTVPTGAVMAFAMNPVPTGWLAANGAAVSRATYATLFAAIGTTYGAGDQSTTFNLPDLRGYFVRGAGTNSDGTVSGTFGVKQASDFKSHQHLALPYDNFGGVAGEGCGNAVVASYYCEVGATRYTGPTGGTETRPANIAMLYCIKF